MVESVVIKRDSSHWNLLVWQSWFLVTLCNNSITGHSADVKFKQNQQKCQMYVVME